MATALSTCAIALAIALLTLGPRAVEADTLGGDKIQHALGFGAILLPAALLRPGWLFCLAPATLLAGGLVEVLQTQMAREGSLSDWLADGIGIALAIIFGPLMRRMLLHPRRKATTPAT